jgi:phenylalanyl-tRNA synthetase alpha chain
MTNVTPTIAGLVGRNLHLTPQHPVSIIKQRVVQHFHKTYTNRTGNALYAHFDDVSPVVTTEQNFDSLLIPKGHVARSKVDNYYINSDTVLRGHTSAHQRDFICMGLDRFLVTGDVYRRDEIDQTHYPAFHQMEAVRLYTKEELFQKCSDDRLNIFEAPGSANDVETRDKQKMHTLEAVKLMEVSLKDTVVKLVKDMFGNSIEYHWNQCYFPFTHPSYELEIKFKGEWMEMLGSGIMRQDILNKGGAHEKIGWAAGFGLDRLAMLLFDIADIRLLWSKDERFISQFASVGVDPKSNITFKPYSKFPPCFKDISFWLPDGGGFSENDFCDCVRSIAGDVMERVALVDRYEDPTNGRVSHCYRLTYRSMDRTLTDPEANFIHKSIREQVPERLGVELR